MTTQTVRMVAIRVELLEALERVMAAAEQAVEIGGAVQHLNLLATVRLARETLARIEGQDA